MKATIRACYYFGQPSFKSFDVSFNNFDMSIHLIESKSTHTY